VRNATLSVAEMKPSGAYTSWRTFREGVGSGDAFLGRTFAIVPAALGLLALVARRRQRIALFYLFASVLFLTGVR